MASDYGKRRPARQISSLPKRLLWLLASFLCGYLTATVFDFTSLSSFINTTLLAKHSKGKSAIQTLAKEPELPKPRFEFYTLLSKEGSQSAPTKPEASIPAKPLNQPPPAAPSMTVATKPATLLTTEQPATAANHSKLSYLVQIAAFKNRQDAEHMKAALTLKGFHLSLTATTQQGVHWYKVIIGPFSSRAAAEKAQLNLARSEHIKGMIRKMDA